MTACSNFILRLIFNSKVGGYYENEMKMDLRLSECANVQIIFTIGGDCECADEMICGCADILNYLHIHTFAHQLRYSTFF